MTITDSSPLRDNQLDRLIRLVQLSTDDPDLFNWDLLVQFNDLREQVGLAALLDAYARRTKERENS